jgi:hypothetical protein
MAYKYTNKRGNDYFLHSRKAKNSGTKLYFFAKEEKDGVEADLPSGYEVKENDKTGLPILKKKV